MSKILSTRTLTDCLNGYPNLNLEISKN